MTRPTTHGVGVRDEGYVFRGAVKRKCTYSGAITISDPKVKLPICKEEIAQGRAGVCTGYVIGTAQGMQARNEICIPLSAGYEDMVQVVVSWIEPVGTSLRSPAL